MAAWLRSLPDHFPAVAVLAYAHRAGVVMAVMHADDGGGDHALGPMVIEDGAADLNVAIRVNDSGSGMSEEAEIGGGAGVTGRLVYFWVLLLGKDTTPFRHLCVGPRREAPLWRGCDATDSALEGSATIYRTLEEQSAITWTAL